MSNENLESHEMQKFHFLGLSEKYMRIMVKQSNCGTNKLQGSLACSEGESMYLRVIEHLPGCTCYRSDKISYLLPQDYSFQSPFLRTGS